MSALEAEFSKMVRTLAKYGADIWKFLTPQRVDLWHHATGISGEAGELIDAVKKHVVYNREIDRENIVEELGDLEFYMEGLRRNLGITREETLQYNMKKLEKRYHEKKYSDAAAQERADKTC